MGSALRVILYGAGGACRTNIVYLPDDWDILAVADRNKALQGGYICEKHKIIAPEDIVEQDYDLIVMMIWDQQQRDEVRGQLTSMGVAAWRIIDSNRFYSEWDRRMYYHDLSMKKRKILNCKYRFEDRSKHLEKLCYVLIGYKEFLWDDVLGRLKRFCPEDVDVCLVSNGLYNERLSVIAARYDWSYLSTDVNDVTVSQDIVIDVFKNAKMIYKMDEDIYVTQNAMQKMEETYKQIEAAGEMHIGYVGPMIPMHSSAYVFLEEFGSKEKYKEHFKRKLVYGGDLTSPDIRVDPEFPRWYWSQGQIDLLNKAAEERGRGRYTIITMRYAICFILFSRDFFEKMGAFDVDELDGRGSARNGDEAQIMKYCSDTGKMGVIALDTVCGHFCYPAQETEMKKFRAEHRDMFDILDI